MSPRRRPGKKLLKAFLPVLFVLVLAMALVAGWIVYRATRPPRAAYLVTPETFSQLSARGLKAANETWANPDGTEARGWLLRGSEGAPAVLLLHGYGADRSHLFNLAVKLNETTNYTVLLPDLRGHGEDPPVNWTSLGGREAEDAAAALDYLRAIKTAQGRPLVGEPLGIYGVELGAYAALRAAGPNRSVRALALDSVPASPDSMLYVAMKENLGLENGLLRALARTGVRLYFLGRYDNAAACAEAATLDNRQVLLLAGADASPLRDSTIALVQCFSKQAQVEAKTDLPLSGINQRSATGEQSETYDRRVIDFFDRALRATQ
ncbi:MAG TPA: alpha/beta fold hydrolase [Pyrinomonadaceae bacterium]|jgi:pimeloyl-ACP methyl ester carboxylesterase|nr:alpha/beta fold hydrolase [Pyrinomonadaceae bacterium]